MSRSNIQYLNLYRPGRLAIILAFIYLIAVIFYTFYAIFESFQFYVLILLLLSPVCIGIIDSVLRKRLLPFGTVSDERTQTLKKLKIRWLLRNGGGGVRNWRRNELELPRTIADQSLEKQLSAVTIPDGLIEPESIKTSKPGSLFGCIVGVSINLLVIWWMFSSVGFTFPSMAVFWIVFLVCVLNMLQLILGLPLVHRSRKLPPILREIGRRRVFSLPIVVGPGWVKMKNEIFRADRDLFLIRRTGFRPASSEIDCMLVGPISRRRLKFSGISDDDFQLLFGAWNVEDVRTEFIHSDLS